MHNNDEKKWIIMITEEWHIKLMQHPFMSCMISVYFKHFIEQNRNGAFD
jgi:hypothetical protein